MIYTLNFSKQAIKELEKINEPFYSNIKKAIINLSGNPRPLGYKKLKGRNGHRIRTGDYRIIYDIIDNELIINVITLGHKKIFTNKIFFNQKDHTLIRYGLFNV